MFKIHRLIAAGALAGALAVAGPVAVASAAPSPATVQSSTTAGSSIPCYPFPAFCDPSTGQPAPGEAGAVSAQPAPPAPAPADAQELASKKEQVDTTTKTNGGFSGWIVLAIVALAGVGIYLLMSRRRQGRSRSSRISSRESSSRKLLERVRPTPTGSSRARPVCSASSQCRSTSP